MAPVSATRAVEHRATATSLPLAGFAVVLGSAALFGTLGPLSRFAYEAGADPAAWVSWRGLTGLLTLLVVIAWRRRTAQRRTDRADPTAGPVAGRPSIPRRAWIALLVAGTMGLTLNLSMFFAFDRITIALALLCFYTYPAMVAVVNVALGREPLDAARLVALALALLGMTLVVASQLDPSAGIRLDAVGIGLALGAALSNTVYVVVSRDGYPEVPIERAIAVVMLITTLGAMAVALVLAGPGALVPPVDVPGFLPLLLFTGIFAAAIPSLGFLYGIRAIGGLRAGILMLFEPVVGVALAAWLLHEGLAPIQVVGALAILAAAVILQRAGRQADEPATHAAVTVGGGP
jgi:drug/metabolite transporter (DMT)-like permease